MTAVYEALQLARIAPTPANRSRRHRRRWRVAIQHSRGLAARDRAIRSCPRACSRAQLGPGDCHGWRTWAKRHGILAFWRARAARLMALRPRACACKSAAGATCSAMKAAASGSDRSCCDRSHWLHDSARNGGCHDSNESRLPRPFRLCPIRATLSPGCIDPRKRRRRFVIASLAP